MKVEVKYFAALREVAATSSEVVETTATNAVELYAELDSKYQFGIVQDNLKVAINECYVDFSTVLKENDTVVFIPPVAGG